MTQSKKDLGNEYDKGPQSQFVLRFPERTEFLLYFQRINSIHH